MCPQLILTRQYRESFSQRWNSGSRDYLLVYIDMKKGNSWSDVIDMNLITPFTVNKGDFTNGEVLGVPCWKSCATS